MSNCTQAASLRNYSGSCMTKSFGGLKQSFEQVEVTNFIQSHYSSVLGAYFSGVKLLHLRSLFLDDTLYPDFPNYMNFSKHNR